MIVPEEPLWGEDNKVYIYPLGVHWSFAKF